MILYYYCKLEGEEFRFSPKDVQSQIRLCQANFLLCEIFKKRNNLSNFSSPFLTNPSEIA